MALSRDEIFEISRKTVISSITNFIANRENRQENFQILDLIIPTERKIRSVVGGMETSLGTTLWEPLAKSLARGNGFEIINEDLQAPANMPNALSAILQILVEGRMNKNRLYTAEYCHDRIRETCSAFELNPIRDFTNAPRGFGVDIWLKKNGVNYFFDTKTVHANVGGYSKFLTQILNWYAYYYSRFPASRASAKIVFPYNPYEQGDFWQHTIGRGWPLEAHNEAWVENEFWNFCSGNENTYQIIREAFIDIAATRDLETIIQRMFYDK